MSVPYTRNSRLEGFVAEARSLYGATTTTETSYYPALKQLWSEILRDRSLPFEVRVGTSEPRPGGQTDRPDLAIYDGAGLLCVGAEVKLPHEDIRAMALSTDRNDQIGRYLSHTGVVLLSNVRQVGLLACKPGYVRTPGEPVPVSQRDLLDVVDLWSSAEDLRRGESLTPAAAEALGVLLERAVTEFTPIAEPATLARVLALQARRAKEDLPERFDVVASLLEDYQVALGLTFNGPEGEEFFRSSLIQTAYYALFAGWTLWCRANDGQPFEWERLERYLKIPFLGKLFYEFKHPDRLEELGLGPHLDRATATLLRVDADAFFARFPTPTVLEPTEAAHLQEAEEGASAITYFYEPFLEAFDPDLRKQLGVWYTPPEVVRYQVAKVDRLLKEELGCSRGFADDRVVVLDPACGTGAYLLEVARHIAEEFRRRGDEAVMAAQLLDALTSRIIGFEILTAPFVISQLQLYLLLNALGVSPGTSQRPAVFLTNALSGWGGPEQVKLNFPELQEEHDAARQVKHQAKIIVILGNPPYNRFAGAAMEEEADLVDHYKGIRRRAKLDHRGNPVMTKGRAVMVQDGQSLLYTKWGIRKHLLDDLYVRFFRLAEKRIGEEAEYGVISFISNASYLTGRSHPIMRESMLRSFHEIWIDNMNGDKYKTGKIIPQGLPGEGTADQSLFSTAHDARGIQVGTAITTCLKRPEPKESPEDAIVHYRDFWGRADLKRRSLLQSLQMDDWSDEAKQAAAGLPEGPRAYERLPVSEATRWIFAPGQLTQGFEAWPSLDELFPVAYQGVNPNRGLDGSIVEFDRDVLARRMEEYFTATRFEDVVRSHPVLATPRARYRPEEVWHRVRAFSSYDPARCVRYLLFPLDSRWLYYETGAELLNRRRPEFWENLPDNQFLVTVPQPRRVSESRPLLSTTLVDLHVHDRGSVCFPVHTRPPQTSGGLFAEPDTTPRANLSPQAWNALRAAWNLHGDLAGPEAKATVSELFRVALAVMHTPQYEDDHRDALAQDWAHLPIPKGRDLFLQLVTAGDRVSSLLDPLSDVEALVEEILGAERAKNLAVISGTGKAGSISTQDLTVTVPYFGAARGQWKEREYTVQEAPHPSWGDRTGDLYLNPTVFLSNVPAAVWRYELGGYPVLKKWLGYRESKRRNGQPLTLRELQHLRSMVHRVSALLALQADLDRLYDAAAADSFTADELAVR